MYKTKMTLISVALVFLTLFSFSTVLAAPQPRWAEISLYSYYMNNSSGFFTNANVGADVDCYSGKSKITVTVTVQKMTSSGWVDTSHTWSKSDTGGVAIDKNIYLSSGNYRSRTDAVVYSASDVYIETVTRYSSEIIIP